MISDCYNKKCDIFLCYRETGAEVAKNFKHSLSRIPNKNFGQVWYSDEESVGNYIIDIPSLVSSAKYIVMFFSRGFTTGFIINGDNNPNCVTIKEIVEIEKRRQKGELQIIAVNIDNYFLTEEDVSILVRVFENEHILASDTILAYRCLNRNNYCRRNSNIDLFTKKIAEKIEIDKSFICHKTIVQDLTNWLVNTPVHWGPNDRCSIQQNANTLEGLLAIKIANYDRKKESFYKRTFQSIVEEMNEYGWQSKTLKKDTVICTAMGLVLLSMEKNKPISNLNQSIFYQAQTIANNLWSCRNLDNGWGVYCKRETANMCNHFATAWALIALSQYNHISCTEDYSDYCCRIFEKAINGTFGFYETSDPKVSITAQYLALLYLLPPSTQNKIKHYYDYKGAISYIICCLTEKNIQVEIMDDEDDDELRLKKAPWKHVSIGAALSACALAYRHGDIDDDEWKKVIGYTDYVLDKHIEIVSHGQVCYVPPQMSLPNNKHFTFPSSYLLWGLTMVDNVNKRYPHECIHNNRRLNTKA